jgi:endo-1,4-beta-xylanase
METAPGINGFFTLTGSLATGTQYWQGNAWLELGTDGNGSYVFAYWDGTSSSLTFYKQFKSFATPPTGTLTVELLHQQGQFYLYFNGTQYGPFADPGLFSLGYVFPGFECNPGQQLKLTQFAFEVPSSETGTPLQTPVGVVPYVHAGDSLGSLAAVTGRTFGDWALPQELVQGWVIGSPSAATPGAAPDPTYAAKVIGEYTLLAAPTMYYFMTETAQGYYTLGGGDAMMAFTKDNGLSVHCHNLIGPKVYLPSWLVNGNFTAAQLTQIMTTHIQTVMGHFKGQCTSWDVVNEALNWDGTVDTSSNNVWGHTIGPSYIDLAFQTAHQVDPNAKLYYNDFYMENQTAKAVGLYSVLAGMQQRGTPIDGVGLQCHWNVSGTGLNVVPDHDSMVTNMAQLAKMGLSARISELDAMIQLPVSAADLATQATFFSTTVQACLDSPNCTTISIMEANDAVSGTDTIAGYGEATLFDAHFQPKPAYTAVMNTLRKAALAVPTAPALTAAAVTNGADYADKGVAPGEIVTLFPTNVGPATLANLGLDADGNVLTQIGGTRVLFDGVAAPMIYSVKNQVAAVVPYEIAGESSTQVQVEYNGIRSVAVTVPVLAAVPGIITVNSQGTGQAVALNQDNSLNSASNPAARGSIVTIVATGEGQRNPDGVTGVPAPAWAAPVLPASLTVGGVAASLPYAASAPGYVGLMQIDLTIPPAAPTGAAVPVQLTIGTVESPSVTIAIK